MCLFTCQHHTVLITIDWLCILKSGDVLPPAWFFFLKISLTIWSLSWFLTNFRIFFFYLCKKCFWVVDPNLFLLHQGQFTRGTDAVKIKLLYFSVSVLLISIFILSGVLQILNWILALSYRYLLLNHYEICPSMGEWELELSILPSCWHYICSCN